MDQMGEYMHEEEIWRPRRYPILDSNVSFLAKWVYRFKTENDALWVQIIKSIHGEEGLFTTPKREKSHACCWKSILDRLSHLSVFSLNPTDCIQVDIGDGNGTRFWSDMWSEQGILKEKFPRIFALEDNKECSVWDRLSVEVESWQRRRQIRDGRERTEETDMKNFIQTRQLEDSSRDRWIFKGAPKGILSSAWIRGRMDLCKSVGKIFKNEWINWIPIKENIFVWKILKGRMVVRKTLAEMDIDIPSTMWQPSNFHYESQMISCIGQYEFLLYIESQQNVCILNSFYKYCNVIQYNYYNYTFRIFVLYIYTWNYIKILSMVYIYFEYIIYVMKEYKFKSKML